MAIYDNRVCVWCGVMFSGGPSARYCPSCRKERIKQTHRESTERARRGATRKLGSRAICANCGEYYVVNGGLQKYCENCKDTMYKVVDNAKSTKYYYERIDKTERSKKRRAHYAKNKGVINYNRRLYYAENRKKIQASLKKWRIANPEKVRKYEKDCRVRNPEIHKKAELFYRLKKRIIYGKRLRLSDCRFVKERYNSQNGTSLSFKQIYITLRQLGQ